MLNEIGNILTGARKSQLTAIQSTQRSINKAELKLASGNEVNSALDNAQNFFGARALNNRASDLTRLLDNINQSIRSIQEADQGVEAILKLIDQAEALLIEAKNELYSTTSDPVPNVFPDSLADFTSYAPPQDIGGVINFFNDNQSLFLDGNLWKRIDLDYTITENTVLRFEYQSTNEPEISAIGFDNDLDYINSTDRFFIHGLQTNGLIYSAPTPTFEYDGSGDLVTIEIPVGQYFTGNFTGLHIVNDDDRAVADLGDALFQNMTLYEANGTYIAPEKIPRAIEYEQEYQTILNQIDALAKDAHYRGTNLLENETLTTFFNETRTSFLKSEGMDATSKGLGLSERNFQTLERLDSSIEQVADAKKVLRDYGRTLSNDLAVISTRESFTQNSINTLKSGGTDLTIADQNEKGAELLALQTRQQIQFNILSLIPPSISQLF